MSTTTHHHQDGLLIIRLADRDLQDQDAAAQIRNKLDFVVETASISQLLINLDDVSFLSSETIGQLILLKKKCDQQEIALALCEISPEILKVLRLVRCDEIIDLYEDQHSAIEALNKTLLPPPEQPLSADESSRLQQRANAGEPQAMFEMAGRKLNGSGMEADAAGSVGWYQKAAELNHREAQYGLATCYAFGLGTKQDYALAMPWYEKAAQQGHADAQYMFGMSLQYALNDVTDLPAARKWYEAAAAQGHEMAKIALNKLPA